MMASMDRIRQYFPEFDENRIAQLSQLKDKVLEWNEKLNLISRPDAENLEERHLLSSLAIARFRKFPKGSRVMDVGTGGGFPGLPLAIVFPECKFLLVDSIGKKIAAVADMAQSLGLQNVETAHARVETIHRRFDFVTGRAVKALPEFLSWIIPHLKSGSEQGVHKGVIYLKGGDFHEECEPIGIKPDAIQSLFELYPDCPFFESKSVLHFSADTLLQSVFAKKILQEAQSRLPRKR
jgi:16S rRNA (guanine527-N7)-methyltransferase